MKYISTRGQTAPMDFSDVLLMGLAPDGGLMLPEHYPNIDSRTLDEWRTLSYPQLAMAIMQRFATDIPAADLQDISSSVLIPPRYLVLMRLFLSANLKIIYIF